MADYSRVPTCQVMYTRLSGQVWDITQNIPDTPGSINISRSVGQGIATASVRYRQLGFTPAHKELVEVYLGYGGDNHIQYTGFVTNPEGQNFPQGGTLQLQDVLWIASFAVQKSKGQIVYDAQGNPVGVQTAAIVLIGPGGTPNNIPAHEAAVRLLRDWAGIPESRINLPILYQSPGVEWVLGKLSSVSWESGTILECVQQIYDALGYWVFADAGGNVTAQKVSPGPAQNATAHYVEGENILLASWGVQRDISTFYNHVIVTGANTLEVPGVVGGGVAATFPVTDEWRTDTALLPSGKDRVLEWGNDRVEYVNISQAGDASCEAIARRLLLEHSRPPAVVSGNIKGDPARSVLETVSLVSPRLGYDVATNFFITSLNISWGGGQYETALTLDGGIGSQGYTENPPPNASITYSTRGETRNGIDEVDIFLAGNATSTGGVTIVGWAWACAGGTPSSGTGQKWATVVPVSMITAVVTLITTDILGKTSSPATLSIPLAASGSTAPQRRRLNIAGGNGWIFTPDSGKTIRRVSGEAALAVPPIGAGGDVRSTTPESTAGMLSTGLSDGHGVRITYDGLQTTPTVGGALGAPILFEWQNETQPLRVWACSGSSVYLSVDGGKTFGPARTPPVPSDETDRTTRWVVESATQLGVIDVLAGRYGFTSFDGGVTWGSSPSLVGPAGSIAKAYTSGAFGAVGGVSLAKHWVGFINCPTDASPLRSYEGDEVIFPSGTSPAVLNVRAVTMMVDTPDLFAADDQGRIWRIDARDGSNVRLWGTIPPI